MDKKEVVKNKYTIDDFADRFTSPFIGDWTPPQSVAEDGKGTSDDKQNGNPNGEK